MRPSRCIIKSRIVFLILHLKVQLPVIMVPLSFWGCLKNMENYMGRKGGAVRYGPRLIDLDLLYFDKFVIMSDMLVVPHPLIKERKFVLLPLAEIAPGLEIEGKKIADFLKICKLDEKVIKIKNW